MKILALGNSFSQDCTAHLGRMTDAYVRNLYIGGCSLERHANNLENRVADYEFQKDGAMLGDAHVTANEIIASDTWDVITVQQVSQLSGLYGSFEPHLSVVLRHIRTLCPTARIVWNQTWAYATHSTHTGFVNYNRDQALMQEMIASASRRVADENGLGLIEVGRAIAHLREFLPPDGTELCRDGFHLSLDYGRYAAALVWARYFGLAVNDYLPDSADPARIRLIREAV
ncbi:MAG: DUF4886 domain-containing protein [Clostridia bacterium]|nr:DUF4886 domain-containing protein [Clostridia bacterium]